MTLDLDRWRHAFALATGEALAMPEAQSLATGLDVVEEALPYLMLRRAGFADCPQLIDQIERVAANAPGPARSGRRPELMDAVGRAAAAAELKAALSALIDKSLETAPLHRTADDATRRQVELGPAVGLDGLWRIGPGPWAEVKPTTKDAAKRGSHRDSKEPQRRKEAGRRPHRPKARRR